MKQPTLFDRFDRQTNQHYLAECKMVYYDHDRPWMMCIPPGTEKQFYAEFGEWAAKAKKHLPEDHVDAIEFVESFCHKRWHMTIALSTVANAYDYYLNLKDQTYVTSNT